MSSLRDWWTFTFSGPYGQTNAMAFIMLFSILLVPFIAFYWLAIVWFFVFLGLTNYNLRQENEGLKSHEGETYHESFTMLDKEHLGTYTYPIIDKVAIPLFTDAAAIIPYTTGYRNELVLVLEKRHDLRDPDLILAALHKHQNEQRARLNLPPLTLPAPLTIPSNNNSNSFMVQQLPPEPLQIEGNVQQQQPPSAPVIFPPIITTSTPIPLPEVPTEDNLPMENEAKEPEINEGPEEPITPVSPLPTNIILPPASIPETPGPETPGPDVKEKKKPKKTATSIISNSTAPAAPPSTGDDPNDKHTP
jgi:hypothetical protein